MQIEGEFRMWCERCGTLATYGFTKGLRLVDAPDPGEKIKFAYRCNRPMVENAAPCGFPIFTAGNQKGLARVALVRKVDTGERAR